MKDVAREIWRVFYSVLTQPRNFFQNEFEGTSTNQAIVVGVTVKVFTAVLVWMTSSLQNFSYMDHIKSIVGRLQEIPTLRNFPIEEMANDQMNFLPPYLLQLGELVFSPFSALFAIVISSVFLFLGNLLFGTEQAKWEDLFKISALSLAPAILGGFLGFLPFGLGGLIAWLFVFSYQLIALEEVLRVSSLRAIGILLTPSLFLLFCACCMLAPIGFLIGMGFSS